MIDPNQKKLSARKQGEIQTIPTRSLYYQPIPEKPEYVNMLHLIDMHLPGHPTERVDSMVDWLSRKAILLTLNVFNAYVNSWAIKCRIVGRASPKLDNENSSDLIYPED